MSGATRACGQQKPPEHCPRKGGLSSRPHLWRPMCSLWACCCLPSPCPAWGPQQGEASPGTAVDLLSRLCPALDQQMQCLLWCPTWRVSVCLGGASSSGVSGCQWVAAPQCRLQCQRVLNSAEGGRLRFQIHHLSQLLCEEGGLFSFILLEPRGHLCTGPASLVVCAGGLHV